MAYQEREPTQMARLFQIVQRVTERQLPAGRAEQHELFAKPLPQMARLFQIVQIVAERQRQLPAGRGVLPVTVQCWLDEARAEQTIRRDMAELARYGYLKRIGTGDADVPTRRGYRVG